ncbi:MAG TPA: hypothetical protein VG105_17995 [Paraburkholderia sp.]|jgi:hypothetical protein|nr:hypothetical protein [Paraburkholderia sp.]
MLDEIKLKALVIATWREGGLESLVKVAARGTVPDAKYSIGFCTKFKFIAGRTPAEIERIVGFADQSKLKQGAEVFLVSPLPEAHEFDLCGYSQTPAGMSTNDPRYVPHPLYPPGEGAPQWNLVHHDQSHLVHIVTLAPDERLRFMASRLSPSP